MSEEEPTLKDVPVDSESETNKLDNVSLGDATVGYTSLRDSALEIKSLAPKGVAPKFQASVTDPEKRGEGMKVYIVYKVHAVFGDDTYVVIRRFSDFFWLREQFRLKHKAYLIPPLPEKAIIGRLTGDFINKRRRGLELFLRRLSTHPVLKESPYLQAFLTEDEAAFAEKKKEVSAEIEGQRKSSDGMMDFFRESVQSLSNTFGGNKDYQKTSDDLACERVLEYAENLDASFTNLHKNTEMLVWRTRSLSKAWFEFGLACTLLGQYETKQDEVGMGNIFAKLGNSADRLSVLMTKMGDQESVYFHEAVKDQLLVVEAVKSLINRRAAALLTYQTQLSTVASKKADYEKIANQPGKDGKAALLKHAWERAQEECSEKKVALDEMTATALSEVERFRQEKAQTMKQVVVTFIKLQIEYSRRIQQAWESILPEIDDSDTPN